jgi:hypothetical protein
MSETRKNVVEKILLLEKGDKESINEDNNEVKAGFRVRVRVRVRFRFRVHL